MKRTTLPYSAADVRLHAMLLGAFLMLPSAMGQSVNSLTIIDATSDQPVPDFDPIPPGATIDTTLLGNSNFNIRSNTTAGSRIGSVVFAFSGATTRNQTENVAPYALFGDSSGNCNNRTFNNGLHTLRATPWSGTAGGGTAGFFDGASGTIEVLAMEGLNAISFLTFSLAGDDDNVFPSD